MRIKISKEEYKKFKHAEKKVTTAKLLRRIQTFKLIYMGWKYGRIADFLSVTKNTISNWIRIYKKGGISTLLTLSYKGGVSKLNESQLSELREEASKGSFVIAKDIKQYIEEKFGLVYHLSHVQKLSKKNFTYPLNIQD